MKVISYYTNKNGVLFQIIRTEQSITVDRVIIGDEATKDIKEMQITISSDLAERDIIMDLLQYY